MKTVDAIRELCLPTMTADLEKVSRWDTKAASLVRLTELNCRCRERITREAAWGIVQILHTTPSPPHNLQED